MLLADQVEKLKFHIHRKEGEQELLKTQLKQYEKNLSTALEKLDTYQKVIVLLQKTSEYARAQMKKTIENIVTNALQVVFGNDMKFVVELGSRAGAPTAEFYVVTPEGLKANPLDAKGGGLVDVISTALRLSILELHEPKIAGPVVLDEPGKMVSAEYSANFAYFLKEYGARVGRQILMITHNHTLADMADQSFLVSMKNGVSEVRAT